MMDIERQDFMKEGNYNEDGSLQFTTDPHKDGFKEANEDWLKDIDPIELEKAKAMFKGFSVSDPTLDELISLDKLFNDDNK